MEEVTGSIPVRSTNLLKKIIGVEVLPFHCVQGQDFACGLRRPQYGSSSIPNRSTNHLNHLDRANVQKQSVCVITRHSGACGKGLGQVTLQRVRVPVAVPDFGMRDDAVVDELRQLRTDAAW